MKKSFIIHRDSLSILAKLTNEEKGLLFQAIADYNDGIEPKLDRFMEIVFEPFRNQFIRDNDGYANRCERNANNGKRGGRPPKPTETEKTHSVISKPKKADSDSDSDSDSKNDNESDIKTPKRFTPPLISDVESYCIERGNNIEPQKFINYYESNGWKVGKNPMKDWKAAIRNWESRDNAEVKPTQEERKKYRVITDCNLVYHYWTDQEFANWTAKHNKTNYHNVRLADL